MALAALMSCGVPAAGKDSVTQSTVELVEHLYPSPSSRYTVDEPLAERAHLLESVTLLADRYDAVGQGCLAGTTYELTLRHPDGWVKQVNAAVCTGTLPQPVTEVIDLVKRVGTKTNLTQGT
ncbi:hypothetical protein D5S17_28490 [Pseudonocardiaceae bacterium YIM PH 21723]|nr:hypothetical protein D5S17_28490 [Pseudonocardiaceae bacterium YIM PH 21723]